jgi:ABC-type glycerol-3-phosphate transport system substrate-binding protein
MRLFASLKMICAAALLTAGFCSCASTETHNGQNAESLLGRHAPVENAADAAYREYINRINQEHGLNL